ncbi:putative disease resistance protein RGA1 [Bienertia sinuspersici]
MAAVAAVGMALGVAQTLFAALQTKEVKEMCSMFRCKGQLEKLEDTVSTIKAVLLDIDSKRQGLTHEGQVWVEKLKDAVYDIDDLLDEFATIVKQRNQMRDAKFSKKVSHFFSRYNKYFIAFNVSQEISMLREKLDAIAKNHADFGFTDVSKPVNRRQETCSKISDLNVIGRDDDKEAVVGMLLSDSQNVSFVNIVGIGGLGKTTLAQLVYNDERVEGAFSEKIWVCVSEDFGIKEILGKILGREVFNLEAMQREVRTLLGNKKYLLVLDDVWNESHDEWLMLKPFLISDVSGSKIIVTTRSKNVATSIGEDSVIYELEGLSKEDSWSLFKRIAFGQRKDQAKPNLVNIGKDIVKKCANVPLSIRVIASLLHTQEERQWQLFSRIDLAELSHHGRHQNSIMPTLMFSYYHLSPELKSCFSFCSLFPNDRIIEKELLISLWLAEGLLVTSYDVQNIEDVGEQYVTILLNRCFSLTTLDIYNPSHELKERCQEPNGQDWPNVCNIPNLQVAAVGLALSVAQTLFAALQTKEVREMCSMFRCKTQLEKLEDTVSTIKALLLDVDSKRQELTHEGQVWVEKLKDAVYDVDDLLDEFTTIGQQRKQDPKLSKKVGRFFSRNNNYFVAFNVSKEIKLLRERLTAIAKNHADFGFTDVTKPVKRREETCSNISDLEVIGREVEKEAIVGMLLSDDSGRNVSFVSIVGMGGLGKTTLAQLVYDDDKVKGAFAQRVWVCVSEEFSVREILGKMLGTKDSTLEEMKTKVKSLLGNKRYLLVLDDVWNESHEEWRKLKPFFVSDVSGSKIIVTSRSKNVATSIGRQDSTMYELKGLSEENSWSLFERIAFGEREHQPVDPDLVRIGKDIVKKCANVPLSIKVIASLLHDQDKSQWQLFSSSNDLAKMSHDGRLENSIMPTLMFSFYQLSPELKSCFSFCSLFPKDHIIEKELLISLWLAQGFIVTTHDVQEGMEGVGERYITMLLNRCFFQDVIMDEYGDIYSFKMHDLMHDLALEIAGKESLIVTPTTENHFSRKIRHLSRGLGSSHPCLSDTLRTYIWLDSYYYKNSLEAEVTAIISGCKHLRVLSLCEFHVGTTLSSNISKLLHLRYLDLSKITDLEMLPKSVTKLYNLQILNLSQCIELKELPEDMSKLVNLRTLDIHNCVGLTYMPRGMSNLTNLHTLTQFVVSGVDTKQTKGSKLLDLRPLKCLKGNLCIRIRNFCSHNMPQARKRAFILRDSHLKNLEIRCRSWYSDKMVEPYIVTVDPCEGDIEFDQSKVHETLVEDLCPNDDIGRIGMVGYEGTKLPGWASMMGSWDVNELQHLTSLSQFRHLKVVELKCLANVEYIESNAAWGRANESRTFFPVLEKLVLKKLPKLKGWWREVRWMEMEGGGGCLVDANDLSIEDCRSRTFFPRLHDLSIEGCESMTYFPPCPLVKRLHLVRVNEALASCMKGGVVASAASRSSFPNVLESSLCLEKLEIDNGILMNSILADVFIGGAVDIELSCGETLKNMGMVKKGLERCASSLQYLSIRLSWKVRSSYPRDFYNFDIEEEEENGLPWKSLQSLSSLELCDLPKMVNLPKGLQYLTSLQSLSIEWCQGLEEPGECLGFLTSLKSLQFTNCLFMKALPECIGFLTSLQYLRLESYKLKSLPESMRRLTSLTTLDIFGSNELKERCRQPDGEDWPKICHIPKLNLSWHN